MNKKILIIYAIVAFVLGIFSAYMLGGPATKPPTSFKTTVMQPADSIVLSENGDIYTLRKNFVTQITHGQQLIEPVVAGNSYIAIHKATNYASMEMFDQQGSLQKTLFNGNTGNIDTMNWISDPAVSADQSMVAYVSDRDRVRTQVPDNALYTLDLATGESKNIANPAPYSGGLAHPIFDPVDSTIILYDYYQYDPQTLVPYSTIEQYDTQSGLTTPLTFENKNAYQWAFSPDGKQLLFLGRNGDTNTVTVYLANYDSTNGLSNIHAIAFGDFAYPEFSYISGYIYMLQAEGNTGYNLVTGVIKKNVLTDIQTVVSGNSLLGNSSYTVRKN